MLFEDAVFNFQCRYTLVAHIGLKADFPYSRLHPLLRQHRAEAIAKQDQKKRPTALHLLQTHLE
ncbi:MAG: hypothetical protein ACKOPS_07970, partial [Cyanobium sp.]